MAFKHMVKATQAGYRDAMEYLSEYCKQGIGTGINLRESRLWRHKALKAQEHLNYLYVDPLVRPFVPRAYFTEA